MAETARPLLLLAALAAACHQAGAPASSFGTLPAGTGPAEQPDGTSTGSTGGGSTSPVSEDSTAAASTGASTGGTTLALDVGVPDLPPAGPEGCRGKIDFLFVISNIGHMETIQDKLLAAFPQFIATIEERFADFDYHIMVVDGDQYWGVYPCTYEDCGSQFCQDMDFPCDALATLSECDEMLGAGKIFNAGPNTPNVPCAVADGKRYIAKGQPDLLETFECIARVGSSGNARLGEALAAAVTPAKTGPCNAGFLRDDALLFVSIISRTTDNSYDYDPEAWAQALLDAKHGDPNAVVILTLHPLLDIWKSDWEECAGWWDGEGSLCQLTLSFPYHHIVEEALADYGQAFAQAAEFVGEACSSFIPR